jgi:transcriptional regulator with XRE-family HTH domain
MKRVPLHPSALAAIQLLALSIKSARKRRRWTIDDLAGRLGVDKSTVIRVEKGDAGVAIGTYFDAAALTGVPLYSSSEHDLTLETQRIERDLALLPARIDAPRARTNDF